MRDSVFAEKAATLNARPTDPCLICHDAAPSLTAGTMDTRFYCHCCGHPTCEDCEYKNWQNTMQGMGCAYCRSTHDELFVVSNSEEFGTVTLRLNGTHEMLFLSTRAVRRLSRGVIRAGLALEVDIAAGAQHDIAIAQYRGRMFDSPNCAAATFLAHELSRNPRARALVQDRLEYPRDSKGYSRICFSNNYATF